MPPATTSVPPLPTSDQLIIPTVHALRELGGSAGIEELTQKIAQVMNLPDEVMGYRREGAGTNEVAYRGAWARTYLRRDGVLERTARGVWALTPRGREIGDEELEGVPARVRKLDAAARGGQPEQEDAEEEVAAEQSWKERLLAVLLELSPDAFERLAQRLLRESGFTKVEVTGRSGDGGIDGVGVLRIQLVSFQVLFQCKRYRETVSAPAIRDFRGAMVGRTDKGLFITTGRFTTDARREATRDGAPPIELIDGEELCELLRALKIGVTIEVVERVVIHPEVLAAI
jgi:restriction system protein